MPFLGALCSIFRLNDKPNITSIEETHVAKDSLDQRAKSIVAIWRSGAGLVSDNSTVSPETM